MSAATKVAEDVDTEVLDDLDFTPECEVRDNLRVMRFTLWTWPKCTRQAQWVALFPCCGATTFVCTPHRRARGKFEHCRMHWLSHQLTWSKI